MKYAYAIVLALVANTTNSAPNAAEFIARTKDAVTINGQLMFGDDELVVAIVHAAFETYRV